MRGLLAIIYLAPLVASASYEMVFIADNGDASNPGRIHRYDPITGAYLGAFGVGDSNNWRAMATNLATGELYASHVVGGGTVVYDFNTGLPKRHLVPNCSTLCQFYDPTSNRIGIPENDLINSFNVATGASSTLNAPAGTSFVWGASAPDGSVYWGDAINDRIYRGADVTTVPTLAVSLEQDRITNFVSATSFIRSNGDTAFAWPRSDLTSSVNFAVFQSATSLRSIGSVAVPAFSVIRGIAPAHHGFYLVGQTPTGTWGLQHVRPDMTMGRFFTLPQIKGDVFDMAGVVAPESGTKLSLAQSFDDNEKTFLDSEHWRTNL